MLVIVVDSMTGLGKKFAEKLGFPVLDIQTYIPHEDHEVFLITRSVNLGEITPSTDSFLNDYVKKVIGVAVSGNRSWGKTYGAAGDKIALKYGIPLVLKFEGLGFPHDVRQVKDWLEQRKKKNG